ncbi:MAG: FAD-dependent oxidoreductase [Oscillospiraceae bacterium]|jgi:2-enoate reductase|nr:FAD-dependent oxidoreductase [Oscillospiraceae bacterium]
MQQEPILERLTKWFGEWFLDEQYVRRGQMTQNSHPYTTMFSPIQINKLTIKNRLVMAPMGNISMCDETGRPNEKMIAYFTERAKGGVGLITTGLVPVTHGIDNTVTELGGLSYFPRIDRSRTVFAGWRDLVQRCHVYGSRVFLQASAGLGRVGNPQCLVNAAKFPCSASLNPNYYMPEVPCLPLTDHQITKIVKRMGQAAADARTAGLDGIYIHAHEGYLIEQLSNPAFNRRLVGKYADWRSFGVALVEHIRERAGRNYPIMYRIDLSLALNATYGGRMDQTHMKKFKNERTIAQTLDYMKDLVRAGVDFFDVDLGCYDNWWLCHMPEGMPPGCYLDIAKITRDYFTGNNIRTNAGQPVAVCAVGKLGYPDLAEEALRNEQCDLVMLGRPLLADPAWPNKVRAGRAEDIIPCIGCQEGCINEFVEGGHPQCAVNPRTAFEEIYPETPVKAENPQKIAVIGGGPAGITCAVTAAKRGHQVTLFEKQDTLGGRLLAGSVPGIKLDLRNYLTYLRHWAETSAKTLPLTIRLGEEINPQSIAADGFEQIVVAVGTRDTVPPVPGVDLPHVFQAVDVLADPAKLDGKSRVLIVGGGVVGCETAYYFAKEHGKRVTVVEMDSVFMNHVCTANRGYLLKYLYDAGVLLYNCTKLLGIRENGAEVCRNHSDSVPNPYICWTPILPENIVNPLAKKIKDESQTELIAADCVVLAAGGRPNEALFHLFQKRFPSLPVYNIGDSFASGKVLEATRSGYALGLRL